MTGLRVEQAVVLAGDHLAAAREAVRIARAARARNNLPDSPALAELAALLAPWPARDSHQEHAEQDQSMTTQQAAEFLGVSTRTVRRLAPGLGGRLIAGRLLLDPAAVREHREGTPAA